MGELEIKERKSGAMAALWAGVIWGFLPIYWQMLIPIESSVIIFYRIVLVGAVCFIFSLFKYGWKRIYTPFKEDKKLILRYIIAGMIITTNWSIYIWAVNADQVIQTSVGYFIEPLMVCVFGIVFFKERFTAFKGIAFGLACLGVVVLIVHFGEAPFVALSIAVTFATYAAIKKHLNVEAVLSLTYETVFLVLPALCVIIYLEMKGAGAIGVGDGYQYQLLFLCGIFTAIPLGLFSMAANKVPLITLGILEYISPSIALVLGIFYFDEPFDVVQFFAFVLVWIGLVFFTIGEVKEVKAANGQSDGNIGSHGERKEKRLSEVLDSSKRFELPQYIKRVTAGHGGETFLILGEEKIAFYDCGMAYCGREMIENAKAVLKGRKPDYVLLSHTHYDHVGALPYIREQWPDIQVLGSGYGAYVLGRPGALKTIESLGKSAAEYYGFPEMEIPMEGMEIDRILSEGEIVSLGGLEIVAYEGKGHTDCSLMYYVRPYDLLFTGESTGVIESDGWIHPSVLKSYDESMETLKKSRSLGARQLMVPHYGILPEEATELFFDSYEKQAKDEHDLICSMYEKGYSQQEILETHKSKYWTDERVKEQPIKAYEINTMCTIKAYVGAMIGNNG